MKQFNFDKKIFFLLVLALVVFGLRLANINEAIYDDESNFAYSLTVMDKFGFNHDYYSPQPLNLLYKPFIFLFGLETWVFRLIPWLFGIINVILLYFLAKKNWGEKVAFWAVFLMLFSFYPTLASLQFDVEGNLVMFSVMLMFFSYLEYEKIRSKKDKLFWQILSGIGLGLAVICKYNSVYIVLILGLYSLINGKFSFKRSFNDLFMIYLVGFVLFLIYVLLGVVMSPENWLNFIWVVGFDRYHGSRFGLMGLGIYLLWSTPLLFGFYLSSIFVRAKKILLPSLWITISILFYTFVLPTAGSMDRYFMHTIPALALLGGIYISRLKLNKKELLLGSGGVLFFTVVMFMINLLPIKYVARFPSLYISELMNFNLNFLFTYTSASGPTFGVNFATIFFSFLFSFLFMFLFFLIKGKSKRIFLILFLIISLSFNLFLIIEYIFHPIGVDVSDVKWEMIDYVEDKGMSYPIYTNDQGIQWYFENDYLWQNKWTDGFGDNEIGSYPYKAVQRIHREGGTIILLNWPPLPEESPAWELINNCNYNSKHEFYSIDSFDNHILIGEVYSCIKLIKS